eukprot:PRCOL_00003362-RA
MARPEEQKNNMMNRWLDAKAERLGLRPRAARRPHLASEVSSLEEAEKWRADVLKEIGRKVQEIQNEGLGEETLRDLNDGINKLVRTKYHWEKRVMELGGPNYAAAARAAALKSGEDKPPDGREYRYYGAAKNLPGVRELMMAQATKEVRRSRKDIYKIIDGDYFGFRDEEDGVLLKAEVVAEREAREAACAAWDARERAKAAGGAAEAPGGGDEFRFDEGPQAASAALAAAGGGARAAPAGAAGDAALLSGAGALEDALPDAADIERMVLAKRKRELMEQYASEELVAADREAKQLLNKR